MYGEVIYECFYYLILNKIFNCITVALCRWILGYVVYVQSPAKEHTHLESALVTWNLPLVNYFENQ